jgi:hypothetical protein
LFTGKEVKKENNGRGGDGKGIAEVKRKNNLVAQHYARGEGKEARR